MAAAGWVPKAKLAAAGALLCWTVVAACPSKVTGEPTAEPAPHEGAKVAAIDARGASRAPLNPPDTRYPGGARVIAIGDIHGDMKAALSALQLAGAIDSGAKWVGGDLVVVQTGDLLDRGDDEPELLVLFERLEREAAAAGGRFLWLSGNHEVMNVELDFRYVSADGMKDYDKHGGKGAVAKAASPRQVAQARRAGRTAAFAPGGEVAKILAGQPIVAIVGDSVFAHGGVLPRHVHHGEAELIAMNQAAHKWMLGRVKTRLAPAVLESINSPIWTRRYSWGALNKAKCDELALVLTKLKVKRLVVGHTVQDKGITSACDGRVWRVDVGMSAYYGGPIQVLEIKGAKVTILGKPR